MKLLSPPSLSQNLPAPADRQAVEVGFARWRETETETDDAALARFVRDIAADTEGERLLASIFGNSPFLTHCCLRDPDFLMRLAQKGQDAIFAEIIARLNDHLLPALDRPALMTELRRLKRQAALTIAIADIGGSWPLERITESLSAFAAASLDVVVRHLLGKAARDGDLILADESDPARDSGFIVLGMGKLGAHELNYSSDIDLILLYDAEKVRYAGRRSVQAFFTYVAQELQRMMAERTADGYVFRTDLRLRPDPSSTPPAVSRLAALTYYESAGQNWERAALMKARPIAGDIAAGTDFLTELTPFLWRKHLDFAAIKDIHSIKRQIDAHRGGGRVAVAGHNIKLGRGGIREIEFFAQTQQLIWGGRVPVLRAPATVAALDALAQTGRITADAAASLTESYHFLRRLEHRLQMVDDAQTHTLPADDEGLRRIAIFMGFSSTDAFSAELRRHLEAVERHYAHLFEEAPSLAAQGNLVFTGTEDDPETLKTLSRLGFAEPAQIAAIVRGWHHGRYRATRSQRARELLTELAPSLLEAFGASGNPDAAFLRFDQFMAKLPAGVQLFSLFYNNPPLLGLTAEIMGAGPRLADEVARQPGLLDGLLSAGFFDPLPPRPSLAADLGAALDRARHYEEMLGLARRWAAERKFQIGVQLIRRRVDGEEAGAALADIAEAVIAQLLPRVEAEFVRAHGRIKGGALAVLGLGKLGSREMTVTSDLDLILIYDAPEGSDDSDGPRALHASVYYARLSQRFINAITALTAEGKLYEIDMRLRPSGASGPLASSLTAFRRYHDELAWTWEHMALTRARPLAGSADLCGRVMDLVRAVLLRPRDPERLVLDVAEMRQRMAEQHRSPPAFEVKHRRGGMVDIEFITQYLQLREAASHPEVLRQNTRAALFALATAEAVSRDDADALAHVLTLWRNVQSILKLTFDEPFDLSAAAPAQRRLLAHSAGAVDFDALAADMDDAADRALALYDALVEAPAAASRLSPDPAKEPAP